MSPRKVLFSRCLAEFYLQHSAKSVNHGDVLQDAVIMFKIRLDTAIERRGGLGTTCRLHQTLATNNRAFLASGLKKTRQEHKDGRGDAVADTTGPMAVADASQAPESPPHAAASAVPAARQPPLALERRQPPAATRTGRAPSLETLCRPPAVLLPDGFAALPARQLMGESGSRPALPSPDRGPVGVVRVAKPPPPPKPGAQSQPPGSCRRAKKGARGQVGAPHVS